MAKQFLEAALTLDAAQREKGRIVFLPTLALAGHGLELMLKACSFLNGHPAPTKGRAGHDIESLWRTEVCEPVRGHVSRSAIQVTAEARASGDYLGVPDNGDVLPLIEEYVIKLSKLHGVRGHPLRYPSDSNQIAPKTPFLVKSLWAAADELVRRPREFELRHFRGQV
jgi:hypothetical protein